MTESGRGMGAPAGARAGLGGTKRGCERLVWAWLQVNGNSLSNLFFVLYLIATTLLFGSVPWSKFAHMFFKPVTALQRRIMEAEGSRVGLPAASDKPKTLGKTKSRPSNY